MDGWRRREPRIAAHQPDHVQKRCVRCVGIGENWHRLTAVKMRREDEPKEPFVAQA